jgi:Protein of unknown function (DUF3035)
MRRLTIVMVGLMALPLVLSGCSGFRTALGLDKDVPNEFDVVNNAPLAIPPDINLRPPRPGAAPTQRVSSTTQARVAIFRAGGGAGPLPTGDNQLTPGERDLLVQAGAQNTPGDIRQMVDQEAASEHPFGNGFVDRLIFWRSAKKQAEEKGVLNPVKEEARLRQEKAAASTVSTQFSSPPTIERKSQSGGFFSHLF